MIPAQHFNTMVSSNPSTAATGTPQPSSDIASRKRTADDDVTGESTAAKKAAISARGQLTMRRSGTPASFHGSMRPSVAANQSSPFPQRACLSRLGPGPGPLSLPTPAKFDIPAGQSSTARSQVLSPASSSTSSFSSAPSSIASFQLSAEVRQSLNRSAPEKSDSKPSLPTAPGPVVAPRKFIPQFGPAHRMPPESDDEEENISDADILAIVHLPDQPQTVEDRLFKAQEQSQVWNYIEDKLENANFTCKSDREREVLLQILQLPKQNDLDDKPMRATDKHQRRYNVIIGSILQVVGVKGHCAACSPHYRKNWEHRKKTCIGLPPDATGPKYRDLIDFVAGRCSNCIRCGYIPSSCHFAAGEAPLDAQVDEIPNAAADPVPGDTPSQNRAHAQDTKEPTPQRPGSKPQARAATAPQGNGDSGHAEAILRDAILVGFRASTQLQPEEQRGFHSWLTALFSFSSSSPDLEDQALAALTRLRQLEPDAQVDIRRRILQILPGAMGRPA